VCQTTAGWIGSGVGERGAADNVGGNRCSAKSGLACPDDAQRQPKAAGVARSLGAAEQVTNRCSRGAGPAALPALRADRGNLAQWASRRVWRGVGRPEGWRHCWCKDLAEDVRRVEMR
jgi:hypothetical protein